MCIFFLFVLEKKNDYVFCNRGEDERGQLIEVYVHFPPFLVIARNRGEEETGQLIEVYICHVYVCVCVCWYIYICIYMYIIIYACRTRGGSS